MTKRIVFDFFLAGLGLRPRPRQGLDPWTWHKAARGARLAAAVEKGGSPPPEQ